MTSDRLSRPDVEEQGDDLRAPQPGPLPYNLIAWIGFAEAFEDEPRLDQQVQPLVQGVGEAGDR